VRHGMFLAISALLATVAFQVPLKVWQRAAPYLFVFGAGLLALVLVPGVGREVNGSQRWLSLYFFNLQPSELMKLFVVVYAADYTVRKAAYMHSLSRGFLPMLGVMLVVGGLLLREPHQHHAFADALAEIRHPLADVFRHAAVLRGHRRGNAAAHLQRALGQAGIFPARPDQKAALFSLASHYAAPSMPPMTRLGSMYLMPRFSLTARLSIRSTSCAIGPT